jgi:hypothetical protein
MNFKHKILAAGLAAIIAGFGIFTANTGAAQTQTDNDNANSTIAQMMQMIETLKQQIQQIIALIAQLKPQETCGNGACRFGETATNCAADCGAKTNCAKEGETMSVNGRQCCAGLSAVAGSLWNGKCVVPPGGFRTCLKCGDGVCGASENECNCPGDCGQITACAKEGAIVYQVQSCCADLVRIACSGINCHDDGSGICAKCGNGICGLGETAENCAKDCDINLNPVCGNKICERGEADFISDPSYKGSCPADCGNKSGEITVICAPGSDCRTKTCYREGEGEIGLITGPAKPCCSGLTPQLKTTSYSNDTQAVTEGFICRTPLAADCKKEGELFGYLEGECCDGLLKVYPDGAKTYSAGESQNFQVTCKKSASYITNAPDKCVAVNIKALANNKYVAAENGGASPLIANRDTAGPWELFYIYPTTNSGINIKSAINGKYVIAENGGSSPLIANRDEINPWGRFVLSPIFNTSYVAIKASANDRLVTAENGGDSPLIANRDEIASWEKFTIIKVSDCQIQ